MIITDSKKHESKDLHIIAIVAIVGIVAIVLGFFANNKSSVSSDLFAEENLVGQAFSKQKCDAFLEKQGIDFLDSKLFENQCSQYYTCSDSDGGINYYIKGTTSGYDIDIEGTRPLTVEDSCRTMEQVAEGYCDGIQVKHYIFTCPNGCKEGACIQECKDGVCDTTNKLWCDNGAWNSTDYCNQCSTVDSSCYDNQKPVAYAGSDRNVYVNEEVSLAGFGYDPDGDAISLMWTIASKPIGSLATLSNQNVPNPTFTPDLVGSYTFVLIVNDGKEDSLPSQVTITAYHVDIYP